MLHIHPWMDVARGLYEDIFVGGPGDLLLTLELEVRSPLPEVAG